jgi:hypothetical protein
MSPKCLYTKTHVGGRGSQLGVIAATQEQQEADVDVTQHTELLPVAVLAERPPKVAALLESLRSAWQQDASQKVHSPACIRSCTSLLHACTVEAFRACGSGCARVGVVIAFVAAEYVIALCCVGRNFSFARATE